MTSWYLGPAAIVAACAVATAASARDLPPDKINQLKPGATTVAQAIALLGEPSNRMKGHGDDTILFYDYDIPAAKQTPTEKHLKAVLLFGATGKLVGVRFYAGP
jgi:hypothetical protein